MVRRGVHFEFGGIERDAHLFDVTARQVAFAVEWKRADAVVGDFEASDFYHALHIVDVDRAAEETHAVAGIVDFNQRAEVPDRRDAREEDQSEKYGRGD